MAEMLRATEKVLSRSHEASEPRASGSHGVERKEGVGSVAEAEAREIEL